MSLRGHYAHNLDEPRDPRPGWPGLDGRCAAVGIRPGGDAGNRATAVTGRSDR